MNLVDDYKHHREAQDEAFFAMAAKVTELEKRLSEARIELEEAKKSRPMSKKQRGSLHVYCQHLATALNDSGWDMKKTLKAEAEIPWTMYSIKENIWKPVLESMSGKDSTESQETTDVSEIYETVNRFVAQRTGVSVPWPSLQEQQSMGERK